VLRQLRAQPIQPSTDQTTAKHRNPADHRRPSVQDNGYGGHERRDDCAYTRTGQQTSGADRDDAVIEPTGLPSRSLFDQPENQENQQRAAPVAHR